MSRRARRGACLAVWLAATACATGGGGGEDGVVAYTGATLWDGSGAPAVPDATLVVSDGRIVSVSAGGPVPAGAREVDLAGRWIVPGLVDAHAHVTGRWADPEILDEAERVRRDLLLFARYGVTTVTSLGGAPPTSVAMRDAVERASGRARLHVAGPVIAATTPAEAREAVAENDRLGVDWIKIRVDDNLGTGTRMPWPAVQAVFDEADRRGLRVATHLFYADDARRLLEMGTDLVAHSIRDREVDAELVRRLRESGACYVPTLTRELSTFVYADRPAFFDDPFFQRWADPREVARVSEEQFRREMATSRAAARYREGLEVARANLVRLAGAGVPIAFGTDAGPAARFPGYFEHLELEMMVDAGLTPERALRAATGDAAACLGLDDVGVLEPGRWADFLVLGADPLADIAATRRLEAVYVAGGRIP